MKIDKEFKRRIKELGLYSQFHALCIQAENIDKVDDFIKLCNDLINCDVKLFIEFAEIVTNKHTRGLRGFMHYEKKDFSHVVKWMKEPANVRSIEYDGEHMNYPDFLKIKHND